MSFFELVRPQGDPGPVVVEVPHAGLAVPEQVADELLAPKDALMRDADPWVDELFADAPQVGATLLCAKVSRYVVDLNRAATDVDPLSVLRGPRVPRPGGRGVIWRIATDGAPVLRRPLSAERYAKRIELFYTPYHTQLRLLLGRGIILRGTVFRFFGRLWLVVIIKRPLMLGKREIMLQLLIKLMLAIVLRMISESQEYSLRLVITLHLLKL